MNATFRTKTLANISLAVLIGTLIGAGAVWYWSGREHLQMADADQMADAQSPESDAPLYWVAPMDANYRRDAPGKSPMGMDLVPVYAPKQSEAPPGTVTISPDVINNLGVRSAAARIGALTEMIDTVGYVQFDEDLLAHIHPRVEGWIETLHVKAEGEPVIAGEPLYEVYSPTLVNAQEELLLALKRDNRDLIAAATNRLSALAVPAADLTRLRETRQVSHTITVPAPQSGVINSLNIREGMYVKPGLEMMTIGVLEHVWVISEVFERQAALVHEGDRVLMSLDYLPGREWQGHVDFIYPALNSKTRTAQVRVRIDNPDLFLRPGMFAQMRIATAPSADAVLIPREALIRTGRQSRVVLSMDGGRYRSVVVRAGRIGEESVEILDGVVAGERVVVSAQFLIDSESSKTADFRRMHHGAESDHD